MIETAHRSYPVDGESFANGKVTEYTVIYEREDIVDAVVDAIINGNDSFIYLGDNDEVSMGEFMDVGDIEDIQKELDIHLLDDDYGDKKHFQLVEDLVEKHIDDSVDYEIEIQDFT